MDLASIKPNTVDVDIIHPGDGEPTGLVITIRSTDDEAVKRVQRKHINQRLKNRDKKPSIERLEEENVALVCAAVAGWRWGGASEWGGEKPDFTPDNVAEVLGIEWIRKQVTEALNEEADFFTS